MSEEFVLLEPEDQPGDEWEKLDVSDTEADRIARRQDREFDEFRKRIKDTEQFKLQESVFDDATLAAIYKLVQDGYVDAFGGPVSTGKEASASSRRSADKRASGRSRARPRGEAVQRASIRSARSP